MRMHGGWTFGVCRVQDELDEIFSLVNKNLGLSGTPDYVGRDTITTGTAFIWLGGSDSEQEGVWKWQNGEPFTFTKWGSVGFGGAIVY